MSFRRTDWRRWRTLLLLGLGLTVSSAGLGAVDVSGVYADKGPVVGTDPAKPPQEVSLHALLSLEFDPVIGCAQHTQTSFLKLIDTGDAFEIRIYDQEAELLWRGRGRREQGAFSRDDHRVILRLRSARFGDDLFAFFLEPLADTGLLEVKVLRVSATAFGPGTRTVGTFIFHRVPEPENLPTEPSGHRLDVTW